MYNLKFTIYNFAKIFIILLIVPCTLYIVHSKVYAVSPTASPSAEPVDEKVSEIRQAIKDKVNQIKEKVEKKAYVGEIIEVTDSVIAINNFRGKQRIRIGNETIIVDSNRKEIKNKELEVEEKIIAMGTVSDNDILDAKRIVVVAKPKTLPAKKLVVFGTVSAVDTKKLLLTFSPFKDKQQIIQIQVDGKNTRIVSALDQKTEVKLKSFSEGQKVVIIYPEPAADKTPVAKTIFVF